jgi:hypothetical protein
MMMNELVFDWNETLKVAEIVGFNPESNPEHKQDVIDVERHWSLSNDTLTEEQREQIFFYISLGSFIYEKYGECTENIPKDIYEWYLFNTAAFSFDAFTKHELDEKSNEYESMRLAA